MADVKNPAVAHADGHHDQNPGHHDQESMRMMGFWIFLITDCIMFGTLFATFVVLSKSFAEGPGPELFQMSGVIAETFILLTSSFTSGLAVLAMHQGNVKGLLRWLTVTILLGAAFMTLEITEFVHLVHEGANIGTSAYWSAFYTLVSTHGIHVSIGLVWMIAIMLQISKRGLTPITTRKVSMVSLYWHFLDVVWIFVFTFVYLMGVM